MREWTSTSLEETQAIARNLAELAQPGLLVSLSGPLGSGKTAFAQAFGRALGIERAIKSPTYTIVKEYPISKSSSLVHVDAYRLEEGGADTIDLRSFLTDDRYILIEWAEFIEEDLPENYLKVSFEVLPNNHRRIQADLIGEDEGLAELLKRW